MNLTFPVDAKLKDGSPVQLVLADKQDIEPLRQLHRVIVEEGASYPHDRFPNQDDFMDYSPSPNTLQLTTRVKARRTLRSLGEGGLRLRHAAQRLWPTGRRIAQDTPQLPAFVAEVATKAE